MPAEGSAMVLDIPCEDRGAQNVRLEQLEEREGKQDTQIAALVTASTGIQVELAGMRGELRGALWASKMGGAVVGSLVALGGSAAVGLLLFLLTKK